MGREWTDEQLLAIDHRGGSMLVSAAAGSGKTAVLVERVMRIITDRENPVDIDELLIITYTKAAAAELRGKIIDKISKRLADDPMNARLYRQLALAYSAKISTVHAYCLELIRANAHRIGIPAEFRIADNTEQQVIYEETLEQTVEECYADERFDSLAEMFYGERDDAPLLGAIRALYTAYRSHPYPEEWAEEMLRCADSDASEAAETVWGKYLMNRAKGAVLRAKDALENAIDLIENRYDEYIHYLEPFTEDLDAVKHTLSSFDHGWDAVRTAINEVGFQRLVSKRALDKATGERLRTKREVWKNCVKTLKKEYFAQTNDRCIEDIRATLPLIAILFETVKKFDAAFSAEKLRQSVADFGDLEHMAIRLLVSDENHRSVTEIARAEQAKFRYIFVDEYQDSNRVQETIFNAVSRGNNLFMVGDIKQSIYSFRLADPTLFGEKLRTFAPAAEAEKGEAALFELSRNFRSRPQVLNAANAYMHALMSEEAGGVNYVGGQVLRCGAPKNFPESGASYLAEVDLIDMKTDGFADEESPKALEAEAVFAAARIEELVESGFPVTDKEGTRPARYSDIVIFLRSAKTKGEVFSDALAARGIPCRMEKNGAFFESTEINVMMSVLAVISNITRDVTLIAALRCPIFGLNADELAEIRLCAKGSFYAALRKSVMKGDKKAEYFVNTIAKWRKMASNTSVDRLIWTIYTETGALGIFAAMENGEARRDNLMKFYELAKGFEHAGFEGLDNFLKYVDRAAEMERKGEESIAPPRATTANAVRIMSIHKSKGLEFPIVLFCNMNHQFNTADMNGEVIVSEELGVGMKRRHEQKNLIWPTITRTAVADSKRRKMLSEELRVMYVALTRPKDKLIMIGALSNAYNCFVKAAENIKNGRISPEDVLDGYSWQKWMVWPLLLDRFTENGECIVDALPENGWKTDLFDVRLVSVDEISMKKTAGAAAERSLDEKLIDQYYASAKSALNAKYTHSAAAETPSKLTATGIARSYYETEAAENAEKLIRPRYRSVKKPNDGLTAAEKGSAVHAAMQHLDFTKCVTEDGVKHELENLVDRGILTEKERDAIEIGEIIGFAANPETRKFLDGTVHREYKFSVLLPAERYYGEALTGENVLLQGVVDLWNESGELRILDFKTDRVRVGEEEETAKKYISQIRAYRSAIEALTEKTVNECAIYFVHTGKYIYVN